MLGFISITDDTAGAADALLARIAATLAAEAVPLAGAVQMNSAPAPGCACDMDLTILGDPGAPVRITQSLGTGSSGCRLDAGALALAAGRAAAAMPGARLVIVNKFGKQEALGGGFRDLIAEALGAGLPVLTSVAPEYRADFAAFAGDLAAPVAAQAALDWCRAALA